MSPVPAAAVPIFKSVATALGILGLAALLRFAVLPRFGCG